MADFYSTCHYQHKNNWCKYQLVVFKTNKKFRQNDGRVVRYLVTNVRKKSDLSIKFANWFFKWEFLFCSIIWFALSHNKSWNHLQVILANTFFRQIIFWKPKPSIKPILHVACVCFHCDQFMLANFCNQRIWMCRLWNIPSCQSVNVKLIKTFNTCNFGLR